LDDGKSRALKQLSQAASLTVTGNTVKVINYSGHKLISGYPEGRRMWVNIKWYDGSGSLLREDGKYGPLTVNVGGTLTQVNTILNPDDPNTKIYEAHYAVTQEWANQLLSLGYPQSLALSFDRVTGAIASTLGQLAAQPPGTYYESFHFALSNSVAKDNRIPPYGMSYDESGRRNALPVPASQYGNPGPGGAYNYWDSFTLNAPAGAVWATIALLYQPTSWEYVQFLHLANNQQNAFLANEGAYLLEAWLNTGMAAPYVMVSATWGSPPAPQLTDLIIDSLNTWSVSKSGSLVGQTSVFQQGATVAIKARSVDAAGIPLSGAQVFLEIRNAGGGLITALQGFTDSNGYAVVKWKTQRTQAAGTYSASVTHVIKNGYQYNLGASTSRVTFSLQ
jgi:hypothetical protein